ncbi:MAG: M13 family metallopeptidase [Porphyromonas sp.]|nr:M13 family metallopeptidase [Porphyromonas sp.]
MNLKQILFTGGLATSLILSGCSKKKALPEPQEDFYAFVNTEWMEANPLKPEYGRYGTFDVLRDSAQNIVRRIISGMSSENLQPGTDAYKAALLYNMVMDSVKLDTDGATPIKSDLEKISAITSKDELISYLAEANLRGDNPFFSDYVYADNEDSNSNILHLNQGGLIMGDRDYYLEQESLDKFQKPYVDYLSSLFVLAEGLEPEAATEKAKTVLEVETELARMHYSSIELRDTHKNYNKYTRKKLISSFKFPFERYFAPREAIAGFETINVAQEGYFNSFDKWFQELSLDKAITYLKGILLDDAASYLSNDFRKASFEFHGRTLGGRTQMQPRWKSAVQFVNSAFGHVVAQEYTKTYFPPQAKERMLKLVGDLKEALAQRIQNLEWMSEETKQKGLEKLATFHVKIGYPEKWDTYEEIKEDASSLYAYAKNIALFEKSKNDKDFGKPVDKERWLMNPHEVNAYYNPATNEICFPAGILQPPFFSLEADDAVNYGAIGVVIGHEMTHGFDDQGRNFDKNGNVFNWWQPEDEAKFKEASVELVKQFDEIIVADDVRANGELTLGENIADQGGVLVSHLAMKNNVPENAPLVDGQTPDQRFFIAYARLWGQNIRKEEILRLTKLDVHSLGKWRVNQTLKNIPAFYEAFQVKEGDGMYLAPEKRVLVW